MAWTRYARGGPARIAYELRGRPWRPALVLVQGLGFDRTGWRPVLRGLLRRFRLVLVDNRGSGRSDPPRGGLTVAEMAADVVRVLDAARFGRAHLLGISLGGMVAQEVAIGYPERVDRLVLCATTPGWPYGYPLPAPAARLMAGTAALPPEVALRRHVENALAAATVADRPALVERLVAHERARPADPGGWKAQAAAGARFAGALRNGRIQAPTLVLHGDADTVVDPRNAGLLAERIPDARLVMLPGLGHLFLWEDPDRFVAEVTGFLLGEPDRR